MDGYIADQQNISEPEVTDTLEALASMADILHNPLLIDSLFGTFRELSGDYRSDIWQKL